MFRHLKQHIRSFGLMGIFYCLKAMSSDTAIIANPFRKTTKFPIYLRVQTSDVPTYEQVFIDQEYSFSVERPPKTIIDAGANIGLASVYFANQWPEATIIAVEPEKSNFELLQKNVAPYANIHPVNAALWSKTSDIHLIDTGLGNWSFMTEEVDCQTKLQGEVLHTIQAITVERLMLDFQLEKIDIFKIDIEGAEKEVFRDTSCWIEKVDAIIIELHEKMQPGAVRSFYNGTAGFDHEWNQGENVFLSRKGGLIKPID
jgi:FkbM family methyltransferase